MKKITTLIAAFFLAAVFTLNGQDFSVSVKVETNCFSISLNTCSKALSLSLEPSLLLTGLF